MATRKKAAKITPTAAPSNIISNCSFNGAAAAHNEHTSAAIVALAGACRENAVALTRAAEALKSAAGMETAIRIEGGKPW